MTARPKAHGYLRVSKEDQATRGYSLAAQAERFYAWQKLVVLRPGPEQLEPGTLLIETGQSAWNIALFQRREGRKLPALLNPGDQLAFIKMDRSFRRVKDFANVLPVWQASRIGVHFIDNSLDLSTANGMFAAHMLVAIAEWESSIKSERTKAALAVLRARGLPTSGNLAPGVRIRLTKSGRRKIVTDATYFEMANLIGPLRVQQPPLSWDKISDQIENLLAAREGRSVVPRWAKRHWSEKRCRTAFGWWLRWEEQQRRGAQGAGAAG